MPPHRAQSSVRVNATLRHPLFTSCVFLSVHVWDHRAYGAVRRVHSFFPYNVTDARSHVTGSLRSSNHISGPLWSEKAIFSAMEFSITMKCFLCLLLSSRVGW